MSVLRSFADYQCYPIMIAIESHHFTQNMGGYNFEHADFNDRKKISMWTLKEKEHGQIAPKNFYKWV